MIKSAYLKSIFYDSRFKYRIYQQHSSISGDRLRLQHRTCNKGLVKDSGFGYVVCGGCGTAIYDHLGITAELNLNHPSMDSDMVSIWVRLWLELEPKNVSVVLSWDE